MPCATTPSECSHPWIGTHVRVAADHPRYAGQTGQVQAVLSTGARLRVWLGDTLTALDVADVQPITVTPPRRWVATSVATTYAGTELAPCTRPGAEDAFALPSRIGQRLHYPSGKTEVLV